MENTRPYYSQRTGRTPGPLRLTWEETREMFGTTFRSFDDRGYFQEHIGKGCPDGNPPHGRYGGDVSAFLLRKLHKRNRWPIFQYSGSYSEDDLFDVIEFLYDNCSKGLKSWLHTWNACGDHYTEFDRASGRAEFRHEVNDILAHYGPGYELSEAGEILTKPEPGFEALLQKPLPSVDPEHVDDVVAAARRKFLGRHATPLDRLDAVRDLAAALERMRPQVEKVLTQKDAKDVYYFMNHFAIRHNRPDQQSNYDKEVIYEWAFYIYLATLHASASLL